MSVPTVTLTGEALTGIAPQLFGLAIPTEPQAVRLGRRSAPEKVARARAAVRLADYLDLGLLAGALPDKVDWALAAQAAIGRMYLNDKYGDCVIAGKAHAVGVWTGNESGTTALVADQTVYQTYQKWCGPGDNGCVITDVLDRCKSDGFPMDGGVHKIDGYADCDHTNRELVKAGIYLFGALSLGINLPEAWTNAAVWDVTTSQIVGGHDVTAIGYDATGVQIASWGKMYTITWAAFTSKKWLEECWALLAPDWYAAGSAAPNGVDAATLKADLAKIGGGTVPPVDPTPPPGPTPTPPPSPPPGPVPPVPAALLKNLGLSLQFAGWSNGAKVGSVAQVTGTAKVVATNDPALPGWALRLLRLVCRYAVALPEPWATVAGWLCGRLPPESAGERLEAVPPWALQALQLVCKAAPYLPAPYGPVLAFLCQFVPKAAGAPCVGCK